MRIRTGVVCAIVGASVVALSGQGRKTERVVLVTMDGARWQEVFAGLDESLLRDSSPKGADITASPAYRRVWAATPAERRGKVMAFLCRPLQREGVPAGGRALGRPLSVAPSGALSSPAHA